MTSSRISTDGLKPGDVLLYQGDSWISKMICKLDGTEASHAGLYIGDDMVAEALLAGEHAGLDSQPIEDSVANAIWVSYYRLKSEPATMQPVLNVSSKYLAQGNRYAYGQILLLAIICSTRKLDLDNPLQRRVALFSINAGKSLLERFRRDKKEPMICSEFVFRTYDEALPEPDDPYSIEILSPHDEEPRRNFSIFRLLRRRINGEPLIESPSVHPDSLLKRIEATGDTPEVLSQIVENKEEYVAQSIDELEHMIEQYFTEEETVGALASSSDKDDVEATEDKLLEAARRFTAELVLLDKDVALPKRMSTGLYETESAASPQTLTEIVSDFVTPGDLLKSPSLEDMGRVK
jgi:hypothetical protein